MFQFVPKVSDGVEVRENQFLGSSFFARGNCHVETGDDLFHTAVTKVEAHYSSFKYH